MEQNKVDYLACLLCNLQLINISEIIYQIVGAAYGALAWTADTEAANCFSIALEFFSFP